MNLFISEFRDKARYLASVSFIFAASSMTSCGSEPPEGALEKPLSVDSNASKASRTFVASPFVPFGSSVFESHSERRIDFLFDGMGKALGLTAGSQGRLLPQFIDGPESLLELLGEGFHWGSPKISSNMDGLRTERVQLEHKGLPVHNAVAITQLDGDAGDQTVWMRASMPTWTGQGEGTALAPSFREGIFFYSEAESTRHYSTLSGYDQSHVREAKPLYYPQGDKLHAAYQLIVAAELSPDAKAPPVPLRAIVDAETGSLLEQTPLAFHATGSAKLYPENSVASGSVGMVSRFLPGLTDPGSRLSSPLFDVKNCQSEIVGRQCDFVASPQSGADFTHIPFESPSYDELVAYYAVANSIDWYRRLMGDSNGSFESEETWDNRRNLGLGTTESTKLTVNVRAITKTPSGTYTPDNAVYLPRGSHGTGAPEIVIGTGWEANQNTPARALRYIGKDADVSMHEFGHHIVFRTITDITGQALAMHEGFSDYFTYAQTGNTRLAESVVSGEPYLRSANRKGTLAEYPPSTTPAHNAGEFWSTVLWDVRMSLGTWNDSFYKFDKIAYHAIDLMQASENYYGAIAALARATEVFALSNGEDPVALKEALFRVFFQRGFLESSDGTGNLPLATFLLAQSTGGSAAIAGEGAAANDSNSSKRSSKKSGIFGFSCSVGAQGRDVPVHDFGTLLLLLALFTAPLLRSLRRFDSRGEGVIPSEDEHPGCGRALVRVKTNSRRS